MWSSADLVSWTLENTVSPNTRLSWDNLTDECWATNAVTVNGTTYFYLSMGPKQIGVVHSVTGPTGPFIDPLGKPLIPEGLSPTCSRDPGVLVDADRQAYLIYGTFNYLIARLNADMVTLAEALRPVKVLHQQHRDGKPFLHRCGETYSLSWGCFYATGSSPYGPFNFSGNVIDVAELANTSFASGGGTVDLHGSFFSMHSQEVFCMQRSVSRWKRRLPQLDHRVRALPSERLHRARSH